MRRILRGSKLKQLKNENGQMTIFIALIFQVLFVFFAMVINIGLLVHDKINLQNAVDFGAYYAAMKQAEILNEIGHINYQIRQDYKLMAWRYRVLGTLGRHTGTPSGPCAPPVWGTAGSPFAEVVYQGCNPAGGPRVEEFPSVCIAHNKWQEFSVSPQAENYCFRPYLAEVPRIPPVTIIAPFIPGIASSAAAAREAERIRLAALSLAEPLNWKFTMQILSAYKIASGIRKQMIKKLRANLVSDNPVDQNMQFVRDGVVKTIRKNLSAANAASFDDEYFQVLNGLAGGACATDGGRNTIRTIPILPILYYTGNVAGSPGTAQQKPHNATADLPAGTVTPELLLIASEPGDTEDFFHSAIGFEKNPWCMAYVAVRAKTRPAKPFLPFGAPVVLEARAFAQPFGGRIGPWYRSSWSKSADQSDAGEKVDPLIAPRVGEAVADVFERLPNFSRFPGDRLGMRSAASMAAQRNKISPMIAPPGAQLRLAWYNFGDLPEVGDIVAWGSAPGDPSTTDPVVVPLREAEVAALAPNAFDAMYYSIDPQYFLNYLKLNETTPRYSDLPPVMGIPVRPPPDPGGRNGMPGLAEYNVVGQVTITGVGNDPALMSGGLAYPIRKWEHLLTSWAPHRAQNFNFPTERFGRCTAAATNEVMIPGGCAQGGRIGYSVRIVSREHLLQKWKIGGADVPEDDILNKPSTDF